MKIISTSKVFDNKKDMYFLLKGNHASMKNIPDGFVINMKDYVIYETDPIIDSETGEIKARSKEILLIYTEDQTIVTESPTIIRTVKEAVEFLDTCDLSFTLTRRQSKAGRTYMNLDLI